MTLRITVGTMVNSKFPKCLMWGNERTFIYNDAYRPLLGEKPEALGRPLAAIWPEVVDELEPLVAKAMAGEATFIEDHPAAHRPAWPAEQCWFTFCYSPVRNPDGLIEGMLNTVIETTEKVEAVNNRAAAQRGTRPSHPQHARHRVGDCPPELSLRQQQGRGAGASQPPSGGAGTGACGVDAIELARRADRPSSSAMRWRRTDRHDEQLTVNGPAVTLSAKQALSLSLALHELATNALKYGALSVPTGRICIDWSAGAPGSDEPFELLLAGEQRSPGGRTGAARLWPHG